MRGFNDRGRESWQWPGHAPDAEPAPEPLAPYSWQAEPDSTIVTRPDTAGVPADLLSRLSERLGSRAREAGELPPGEGAQARERTAADRPGDGDTAGSGQRRAADRALARLRDAADVAVTQLRRRADEIRVDVAAGRSPDAAAEELSWIEDAVPQIEAWAEALGRAAKDASLPPGQVAYILLQGQAITRQARRQRRAHQNRPLWEKFWVAVEQKLPWLAPALAAKTHVREWTLGVDAGFPPFVNGHLAVTCDEGGGGRLGGGGHAK